MKLALTLIRTDGGTQPRAEISMEVVERYQEAIEAGAALPPIVVFYDGTNYWLADGFHRYRALRAASKTKADIEVKQGTQRDAILFSVGANALHGLPRTNADKRRAIDTLLADSEWVRKSDRWIAEKCAVHHDTVATARKQLADSASSGPRTGKDGKTRRRPTPVPPARQSVPLDVAPEPPSPPIAPVLVEASAPIAAPVVADLPAVIVAPPSLLPEPAAYRAVPRIEPEEWTKAHEVRVIEAALRPAVALAGSWPADKSIRLFIDSLRALADRLEGQEEEKSCRAN